jgi:hypothetical protein
MNHWKTNWAQLTGKMILSGIETSGGGISDLGVVGMRGIYSFCAAVIVSILLRWSHCGLDVLDHSAQTRADGNNDATK